MSKIFDKIREQLNSEEESPEVEEDIEKPEPNPLEDDIVAGSGIEINDLAAKISYKRGVTPADAAKSIHQALDEGKIRLIDPNPPTSLFAFLSPIYNTWFWLTLGFIALLLFTIYLMPQVYPLVYLRYATGAVYILYLPGYTLIESLYPKRDELERLERFALSVGLSLALVPLVGLVLNYTPWGIRLDPIFISLSILTIALSLTAIYRKYSYWKLSQGLTRPIEQKTK